MLKSYKNINNFVKNTNDDNFSDFADDILFSDILDLWLKESRLKVKQSSINKYEYLINKHIKPQLGSYKMSQLNSEIINNFTQSKLLYGRLDSTGGLANSYVRSINIVISSAIKSAIEKNIYVPIFKPIYKPTIEKRVLKILSQKEQKKLEEHLYKHLDPTAIGILLTLYAGLRIGEVLMLFQPLKI